MVQQKIKNERTNELSAVSSSGLASNAELIEFEEIQQKLDKWTIPKVDPKLIYKIGIFDFRSRIIIKSVESNFNLRNQDETYNLLHAADLMPYYKKI